MGFVFSVGNGSLRGANLAKMLLRHFGVPAREIATAGRQFPITARLDVQHAIETLLRNYDGARLLGIVSPNHHEAPTIAQLTGDRHFPIDAGPLQYDEIDIGEAEPARCLKNGLWLCRQGGLPFAILMAPGGRFGLAMGVHV